MFNVHDLDPAPDPFFWVDPDPDKNEENGIS